MDQQDQWKWSADEAQRIVRESYGAVVPKGIGVAESLYVPDEIAWLPQSVKEYALGLGNPIQYANLQRGEAVLDVGSGAGIDTFIAAKKVGPTGRVIGLDMTPVMIERARANQKRISLTNIEFRQGVMEKIPLDDANVDVAISNGVINLSTAKERLALYPLFDTKFLDWLYAQFPEETLPIYLAHFHFTKPGA